MHWHGLEVPIGMDGVPGISQDRFKPGGTFTYEFTLHQNGTFFYHSHMAMQEMMGMIGLFIIHPKDAYSPAVDRDFGIILQEWAILPNNTVPNIAGDGVQLADVQRQGRPGDDADAGQARRAGTDPVRQSRNGPPSDAPARHQFYVTGTEGGRIPESAWHPGNTVLVGVAQARDIEFDAKVPATGCSTVICRTT